MVYSVLNDLENIFHHTQSLWHELRNKSVFITGGTGFFGYWLLSSFLWANEKLNLNANIIVLTRNKIKIADQFPELYQNTALEFLEGDVRNFVFPKKKFRM